MYTPCLLFIVLPSIKYMCVLGTPPSLPFPDKTYNGSSFLSSHCFSLSTSFISMATQSSSSTQSMRGTGNAVLFIAH